MAHQIMEKEKEEDPTHGEDPKNHRDGCHNQLTTPTAGCELLELSEVKRDLELPGLTHPLYFKDGVRIDFTDAYSKDGKFYKIVTLFNGREIQEQAILELRYGKYYKIGEK